MATAKNAKTTAATDTKKAATKKESKKSATMEQIEKLEKALENTKNEDVVNLVPEEIRADIEAENAEVDALENPKDIDFDAEVKKIIETAEPSEEVKEQVDFLAEQGCDMIQGFYYAKPMPADEYVKKLTEKIADK